VKKLQLHYWYIREMDCEGEKFLMAKGVVSGHDRLIDTTFIHTSEVKDIRIDKEAEDAIITTRNSVYHCPLAYCRWSKQDENSSLVPEYAWIKENFKGKINYPIIEDDKVLLVLSNFDEYYFNSLYYKPSDVERCLEVQAYPHVGMFQDSYLIWGEDNRIDVRYFPHFENIEFYSEDTDGKPFFIENIGDIVLYAKTSKGYIKVNPGERKEVSAENAEEERPVLDSGDLYPAVIIEKIDEGDED